MSDKKLIVETIEKIPVTGTLDTAPLSFHTAVKWPGDALYLSDEFNHRIVVIDPSGKCVRIFGQKGHGQGEFWYPRGMAFVNGELFVCDAWNHRVQRFTADGTFIATFGKIGGGDGEFNEPVGIIPADNGRVWILDRCNHRVVLASAGGVFIKTFGSRMTAEDEDKYNDPAIMFFKSDKGPAPVHGFNFPQAFAICGDGDFVIADTGNRRLCKVSPDGEFRRVIPLNKDEKPPYFYPESITTLSDGRIAVAGVTGARLRVADFDPVSDSHFYDMETPGTQGQTRLHMAGDGLSVMFADGKGKTIVWFRIPPKDATPRQWKKDEPLSFINMEKVLSLILALPEDETKAALAKSFVEQCAKLATDSAGILMTAEGDYCKNARDFFSTNQNLKVAKLQGGAVKDVESALFKLSVDMGQLEKKMTVARRNLVYGVGGASVLFSRLSPEFRAGHLAEEERRFHALISGEYANRKEDFRKTLELLKNMVSDVNNLTLESSLHACLALGFLHGHMDYLRRSISMMLTGVEWEESENTPMLPEPLMEMAGDRVNASRLIYFALGAMAKEWGMLDQALTLFNVGAAALPEDKRSYLLPIADIYRQKKQPEKAMEILNELGDFSEEKAGTGEVRGYALLAMERYAEALPALLEAVEMAAAPGFGLVFHLAFAYDKLRSFKHAIEWYRRALNHPDGRYHHKLRDDAILGLAHNLIFLGEFDAAKEVLDKNPLSQQYGRETWLRAVMLRFSDDPKAAAETVTAMLAAHPDVDGLHSNAAVIYMMAGDESAARKALEVENAKYPKLENRLVAVILNRIAGKFRAVCDEMAGDEYRPHAPNEYLEMILAAHGMGDGEMIKKALHLFLSVNEKTKNRPGIINVPPGQADFINKAVEAMTAGLRNAGGDMAVKKIGDAAIWVCVNPG